VEIREPTMEALILSYDEMASLRSFLIATVFEFFDAIEMETIGYFDANDILDMAKKIHSRIEFGKNEYVDPFNRDELDIIHNCILHGEMGLGLYQTYKIFIDYKSCVFDEAMKRIYSYIKSNESL